MLHSHDTWRRISIAAIFAAALIGICTVASAEDPGATPDAIKDRHPYAKEAVEHYNKAVKLHENGFVNQAVIEYESAIAADNRMEEAYCNVGVIYSAQHKYDKALDCFQKALSLVPDRVVCLNGLGT